MKDSANLQFSVFIYYPIPYIFPVVLKKFLSRIKKNTKTIFVEMCRQ